MERAFDGHMDMAEAEIRNLDGMLSARGNNNLRAHLHNAFQYVKPSAVAIAAASDVEAAYRKLLVEIQSTPYGMGKSEGVEDARRVALDRLRVLRQDLHACAPSDTARALGVE